MNQKAENNYMKTLKITRQDIKKSDSYWSDYIGSENVADFEKKLENNSMYIPPDALERYLKEKFPKKLDITDTWKKAQITVHTEEFLEWLEKKYGGRQTLC